MLAVTLLLLACSSSQDGGGFSSSGGSGGSSSGGSSSGGSFGTPDDAGGGDAGAGCSAIDILFVIDNSGSMGEEQTNLAANFPKFVAVLDALSGPKGPLDYRVAVTTTAKTYKLLLPIGSDTTRGDDGAFRNNCGGSKRWLERSEASTSFACRAQVGTDGSSEEMPLECMKLGLVDRVADGVNAGFLRKEALLAVVFLTDEDDCSTKRSEVPFGFSDMCEDNNVLAKASDYVAVLDGVKGERARWATAVIAGKSDCMSSFGSAAHAKRMDEFVNAAGRNAVFSSICDGDLSIALKAAIDKFGQACRELPPLK